MVQDPSHNMCSSKNNRPNATCASAGGPPSVEACPGWFARLWEEQKEPRRNGKLFLAQRRYFGDLPTWLRRNGSWARGHPLPDAHMP